LETLRLRTPDGTVNATEMMSLDLYALGAISDGRTAWWAVFERVEPSCRRIGIPPRQ
jgi:hypothetical protein